MIRLRRPSPALLVALVALFSSLTGTATGAAVIPLAKRALFADNAGKLQGRTAAQVARIPGPATAASGLVSVKTGNDSVTPQQGKDVRVSCDSGKAIGGGFSSDGAVLAADSRPENDTTWSVFLVNVGSANAAVTVYAVCLR